MTIDSPLAIDSPQTMWRSAAKFFSGTLLSRFSGFARDMAMAFAFGTGSSVAAFFVAFRFAYLFRRLLGEGPLQNAFIPHFEKLRANGEQRSAAQLFVDLYAALTLILMSIIGVGWIISKGLLIYYQDFFTIETEEVIRLSLMMLPSLLFICLAGLHTALLQCQRYYFLPSFSPIAFNLVWIAAALLLRSVPLEVAVQRLAVWIAIAYACQWLFTFPKVVQILKRQAGGVLDLLRNIHLLSTSLKQLWKPFLLGIIGVGASQLNTACDAFFALYADSQGPAFLWYAIRLQQLPLALFGIALASALLPPLARAIKSGEKERSLNLLSSAFERSWLLMIPITLAIFLLGAFSIELLYGHGDFTEHSVEGTAACLYGYAIGLIPMTFILIIAPIFYSHDNYRTPAIASACSVVVNLALNIYFVLFLGWGAFSIALATSFSAWFNFFWLACCMEKQMRHTLRVSFFKTLPGLILGFFVFFCLALMATSAAFPKGILPHKIGEAAVLAILFFTSFILCSRPLRRMMIPESLNSLKKRFALKRAR